MDSLAQYNALFANATSSASTQKANSDVRNAGATALATKSAQKLENAKQAAEDFEAVFIAQMLGPIFDTLETDGPFGGGPSEKIYRSLMVQEYGKSIAKSGGIGISDSVQREILKLQEVAQ
ncbi:rod-binding protein [Pelagibius sp. Alg239-R121]|uniref:rod-binding protein n=1 Tax=Pelagibius sp. Alg239-R121 TaxID=2993448 RepID=UPI0024A728E6|nr:rod-binding protein [Pelagibius sp. Alg239-R121]